MTNPRKIWFRREIKKEKLKSVFVTPILIKDYSKIRIKLLWKKIKWGKGRGKKEGKRGKGGKKGKGRGKSS